MASSPAPGLVRIAVSQSHTLPSLSATLSALETTTQQAQAQNIDILLFPEAYLGGYPRGSSFGSVIGNRLPSGRDQFLHYWNQAVDLGDTPRGAGEDWVKRRLPVAGGEDEGDEVRRRGDGTRERLEAIAKATGVFLCVGIIEKAGGSLYCAAVYVCPRRGTIGKHRKVMPTGVERLVWAQGSPASLKAVVTHVRGVRIVLASAICWENYMPLLRQAVYEQGVNLWLAPTADARPAWTGLMTTVGVEGRCFVLSANQCLRWRDAQSWITGIQQEGEKGEEKVRNGISADTSTTTAAVPATLSGITFPPDDFACRGGSLIASPFGDVLAGPLWEVYDSPDSLLWTDVDFDDCARGRLDIDVSGSYSRNDAFKLEVEGLSLVPPP